MSPHDRFYKVSEVERCDWRAYTAAAVWAVGMLALVAAFI